MAQTVLITLTTAGADTGPFDLLSNLDGYTVPFESSVPKLDLEAGYVSTLVPDGASIIRVKSISALCTSYVDLNILPPITTTTTTSSSSTTTTTTTSAPDEITLEMSLIEGVPGSPQWRATWNAGGSNRVQICTGTSSVGPTSTSLLSSTVTCIVTRPSGVTADAFDITWLKNGSPAPDPDGFGQDNPETGPVGTSINFTYTYTGVVDGDQLSVQINEG